MDWASFGATPVLSYSVQNSSWTVRVPGKNRLVSGDSRRLKGGQSLSFPGKQQVHPVGNFPDHYFTGRHKVVEEQPPHNPGKPARELKSIHFTDAFADAPFATELAAPQLRWVFCKNDLVD